MTTATRNGFSCNLFNISGNTTLQDYKQEILNPYTILGFKDKNDFESQINELCDSNRKQLRDKLWSTFEKQIEKDKKNSKAARNVDNTIGKTRNIESKLNNVLTLKKQVQAFFEDQHNKNITPNAIDPQEVDVKLFNRPLNKPINKRKIEKKASITSNWQDYEQILKYIESLEEEIGITLEELKEHKENSAKTFLLNRVNLLNKKYPKSQNERKSAVKVLADEKLRAAYDRLQDKALRPLISYKECRNLYDKMNQMKNESKSIIKREEREKNLKKIDKSIVSAINDIKNIEKQSLTVKTFKVLT